MPSAAGFRALLWKDARRELRQVEGLAAGLVLVLLFLFVDLLAFPSLPQQPAVAAVVLWTPLLFGATAVVARGFASEADLGTLDLARSLPLPLALHGWSRTLLHLVLLALLAALTVGVAAALFALRVPPAMLAVLALAVGGLAIVGTLASAIAA
jgi:ABC-type transport system involved in cytochrome c biogenesis permease component